jgi:hypothetical protein
LPDNEAVRDLAFSPDGAWLAFRAGPANAERLYLYPLRGGSSTDATPVPFACPSTDAPCAVLDYAWSLESEDLAVVLSGPSPAQDYVSGVSVAAPSEPWPVADSVVQDAVSAPLDYLRDLVWAPGGRFAFVGSSSNPFTPESVFWAPAGLASPPLGIAVPSSQLLLRATASGWIAFDSDYFSATLINPPNGTPQASAWIAPSGRFIATTLDGQLQIFGLDSFQPLAVTAPNLCPVVVAWAPAVGGHERIVCSQGSVIDAPSGAGLIVFDYQVAGQRFEPAAGRFVPINDAYQPAPLANTHRLFSPEGDWLIAGAPPPAAQDQGEVSVALVSVPDGTPTLPRPLNALAVTRSAEMKFTPDGHSVLIYDGDGLRREPIPAGIGAALLSGDASASLVPPPTLYACEETVWTAPDNWCGAPETLTHFAVSLDSKSVLFEDAAGGLWRNDLSAQPARPAQRLAERLAACPVSCAGTTYAFQP